jgi:hypothetical protein
MNDNQPGRQVKTLSFFLSRTCKRHRLEKKYLIVPSYQISHQVGEALTLHAGSWVNLHFAKLLSLAQEIE